MNSNRLFHRICTFVFLILFFSLFSGCSHYLQSRPNYSIPISETIEKVPVEVFKTYGGGTDDLIDVLLPLLIGIIEGVLIWGPFLVLVFFPVNGIMFLFKLSKMRKQGRSLMNQFEIQAYKNAMRALSIRNQLMFLAIGLIGTFLIQQKGSPGRWDVVFFVTQLIPHWVARVVTFRYPEMSISGFIGAGFYIFFCYYLGFSVDDSHRCKVAKSRRLKKEIRDEVFRVTDSDIIKAAITEFRNKQSAKEQEKKNTAASVIEKPKKESATRAKVSSRKPAVKKHKTNVPTTRLQKEMLWIKDADISKKKNLNKLIVYLQGDDKKLRGAARKKIVPAFSATPLGHVILRCKECNALFHSDSIDLHSEWGMIKNGSEISGGLTVHCPSCKHSAKVPEWYKSSSDLNIDLGSDL